MTSPTRFVLRRFVTDGLRETIDSYAAGTLPLHRFAWELDSRLNDLAEVTGRPHGRLLTGPRDAARRIAAIDATLRAEAREVPTDAERRAIAGALTALRATLDPPKATVVALPPALREVTGQPTLIA